VAERRAPLSRLGGGSRSASGSASRANSKPTNRATHEEASSRREFGRGPSSQRRSTSGSRPTAAGCNFGIVIFRGRGRPPRIDRHDAMIVEVPGTPALNIPARRRHRCRCRRRRRRRRRSRRPPPVFSSLSPRCASLCVSPFLPRSTSTSPRLARPCAPARRRSGLRRVRRISFRQPRASQR